MYRPAQKTRDATLVQIELMQLLNSSTGKQDSIEIVMAFISDFIWRKGLKLTVLNCMF